MAFYPEKYRIFLLQSWATAGKNIKPEAQCVMFFAEMQYKTLTVVLETFCLS